MFIITRKTSETASNEFCGYAEGKFEALASVYQEINSISEDANYICGDYHEAVVTAIDEETQEGFWISFDND